MKTEIAKFLGIDEMEIHEIDSITKDEIANYTRVHMFPTHYTDEYLIFTTEAAYKHWQYYAGFEYLEEAPEMLKKGDLFIAAYSLYNDTDGRIGEYLDIILEINPEN